MYKATEEYEVISEYKGLQYAVWFNDVQGYRCGYVKIPEDHPYFEKKDDELNITSVGLTFEGHIKGLSGWFIGWDHHHIWEGIDEEGIRKAHTNLSEDELETMLDYARVMAGDRYGFYSTKDDVEEECHRVIEELIRIGGHKDEINN